MNTITIMGLGYIGLPSAALLASRGYSIRGVDVVPEIIDIINEGKIHIVEPELDEFVRAGVDSGRLKAELCPAESDIFIIAVPTPFKNNYEPDLQYVRQATLAISPFLRAGNMVILESTSPVGTTQLISDILEKEGHDTSNIYIAHCPERVLPGKIMIELIENDRIIGGLTPEATKKVADFYRTFVSGEVLETDAKTAEMSKLVENSSRDVQIAFANELSIVCSNMGINVWDVISLANRHPRVNILNPGTGVGGHCIAVDPWFIVNSEKKETVLIKTARERNLYKTDWIVNSIINKVERIETDLKRKARIATMGMAFKADIDDLRESPSLYVVENLIDAGLDVFPVEPNLDNHEDLELYDYQEIVQKVDLIVFLVPHKEFFNLNTENVEILDFCGVKEA